MSVPPEALPEDQRGLVASWLDDRHGRAAGAGVPGRELHLGREAELGDQAVAAGRPAETHEGVAADPSSWHGRQPAAGHGRDLELHGQFTVVPGVDEAHLEREETPRRG